MRRCQAVVLASSVSGLGGPGGAKKAVAVVTERLRLTLQQNLEVVELLHQEISHTETAWRCTYGMRTESTVAISNKTLESRAVAGSAQDKEAWCDRKAGFPEMRGAQKAESTPDPDVVEVLKNLRITPGERANDAVVEGLHVWATVEDQKDVAEALQLARVDKMT